MHWIDWTIVGLVLLGLGFATMRMAKLSNSVVDFLSAGRCAGRYLLATANDMGTFAAIFVIATFEQYYHAGFGGAWWGMIMMPLSCVMMATGWVQYRFRETRALTMAHFLEMRYSKKFRIFAGILAFTSGILNYGIFPGVTARFLIAFCRLPTEIDILSYSVPTMPIVMLIIMGLAMAILASGGLVTVMVTDFIQGQLVIFGIALLVGTVFVKIGWTNFFETLGSAPEGKSMINPFDQSEVRDFNIWFFLILAFNRFYAFMAFPTVQGYFTAAKSPHESKMARMLGDFQFKVRDFTMLILPLGAWVIMHSLQFAAEAQATQEALQVFDDPQTRKQMLVPVALSQILPIGVIGVFAAMMIAAAVSTDNSFIHSWGSIFIEDVLIPLRGKKKPPLSTETHMRILRFAIIGVSGFAFIWSMVFPVQEYIFMYFQITSSLYVGGAGAVIIGGLYWNRGTTTGAWVALFTGLALSSTSIVARLLWPQLTFLHSFGSEFPFNGVQVLFGAIIASTTAYITTSLITCKSPHDMDKLLNRGKYQVAGDHHSKSQEKDTLLRRLGLNKEFSKGDKLVLAGYLIWTFTWFGLFLTGNTYQAFSSITDSFWTGAWQVFMCIILTVGAIMAGFFVTGGIRNVIELRSGLKARHLAELRRAEGDGLRAECKEDDCEPALAVEDKK